MIEVFHKVYEDKVRTEVSYYFLINNYGSKKFYEVIYEMISDVSHYYSKYHIELNEKIRNIEKIENDMMKFTPLLFLEIKQKRRLAVLAKFTLFIISTTNNISLYKLPKRAIYYNNGDEIILSPHAFANSAYALTPFFEKIYHP